MPLLFADTTPLPRTGQGADVVRSGPLVRTCGEACPFGKATAEAAQKEVLYVLIRNSNKRTVTNNNQIAKEMVIMMKFEEFTDEVKEQIKNFLPEDFAEATVELIQVVKNNDLKLTGLNINNRKNNICPTIYLEGFYEEYKAGKDIKKVLQEISEIRIKHNVKKNFDIEKAKDYAKAKNYIVPRIINSKWNKDLLKDRPYTKLCDLAVTYHIVMNQVAAGVATTPVTNNMIADWDVDTKTIHETSMQNMRNLFPTTFQSINYAMNNITRNEPENPNEGFETEDLMYVLSNTSHMNGASAILDEEIMHKIIDKLGKDFTIIPSSIHELIIVKSIPGANPSEIAEMINAVNNTSVEQDIRLSDHPYRYSVKDGLFI